MLSFIWTFAATAVSLKMVFFYYVPEWLGLSMYLGMGWIGLLSGFLLWRCCGRAFVRPLLWGGLAYTLGAVLDFVPFPAIIAGVLAACRTLIAGPQIDQFLAASPSATRNSAASMSSNGLNFAYEHVGHLSPTGS